MLQRGGLLNLLMDIPDQSLEFLRNLMTPKLNKAKPITHILLSPMWSLEPIPRRLKTLITTKRRTSALNHANLLCPSKVMPSLERGSNQPLRPGWVPLDASSTRTWAPCRVQNKKILIWLPLMQLSIVLRHLGFRMQSESTLMKTLATKKRKRQADFKPSPIKRLKQAKDQSSNHKRWRLTCLSSQRKTKTKGLQHCPQRENRRWQRIPAKGVCRNIWKELTPSWNLSQTLSVHRD